MTQLFISVIFLLPQMGALKVSELEKKLIDKGLTLSPLAVSHHLCGVCGPCVFTTQEYNYSVYVWSA